jgi:hypothetical protein
MSAKPVPNFAANLAEARPNPNVVALGRGIKVLKLNGKNIVVSPSSFLEPVIS